MSLSLENKHAIVCGSSDGIGKASALKMAQQGCEITLVARDKVKLDAVLSVLNDEQGQVHQIICSDFNPYSNNFWDATSKCKSSHFLNSWVIIICYFYKSF